MDTKKQGLAVRRIMIMICDTCAYMVYDEDYEEYVCDVDMDEDDFQRLMEREYKQCPYYKDGDEYKVVRHQI